MKNFLIVSLVVFTAYFITGCTKGGKQDGVNGNIYTISSLASSKQLVPAVDTASTGTFTGLYDEQANILTYSVSWNDLWRDTNKDTLTAVGFYGPASATTTGKLVRSIPFISTNRISQVNLSLAGIQGLLPQEKNDFLSGLYYFTLNTKKYPNGIIRGQLNITKK